VSGLLPDDGEPSVPDEPEAKTGSVAMAAAIAVLVGLAGLVALVMYRIYPDGVPSKKDPGFIDNIFDNNLVVFAARLVLFSAGLVLAFAAVYIVVSIINWFGMRQWLTRAGPFEVSQQAVATLQEDANFWRDTAVDANAEVQALSQRLGESDATVEQLYERLMEQEAELERLREEAGE
jgi:cytoskeletal protein RodZ